MNCRWDGYSSAIPNWLRTMKLTIIIPTFNEVENLPKIVSALFDLPISDLKLLIVDDNSPDGTGDLADKLTEKYPGKFAVIHRASKQGLGTAYLQGFKRALDDGADYICQMDADFSHPPQKIIEMYEALDKCDVVLGSRYVQGGQLDMNWPLWRKWLSAFGNIYARLILWMPVHDVTGGFRMWRKETLLNMPFERVRSNGYSFQVEILNVAHRLGFRITEIPIYFAERDLGSSKMSLRIQVEAAFRIFQIRWAYRDLAPISQKID